MLPDFCQVPLIGALLLTAAAILCTVFLRKGSKIPLLLTGLAVVLYGTFLAQWGNLSGSLLFVIFLKLQAWIYIPLVILAVLLVFNLIDFIRHGETALDDRALRLISGVLAAGILLVMLLPVYSSGMRATSSTEDWVCAPASRPLALPGSMAPPSLHTSSATTSVQTL